MKYTLLLIFSFSSISLTAQLSSPINKIKADRKIESLFKFFNNKNSPGFAIRVIQNGKVITKKTVGMASIEFGVSFSHITSEYYKSNTLLCLST